MKPLMLPKGRSLYCSKWYKWKFKFLQNISHYCNTRFSFQMHMFTILVLSLNELHTTIHSNIRFVVIHMTKIYISKYIVRNPKNNITIHFIIIWYYKKITQKMNIEFIVEVCVSLYYWKH
jgi:hypothetical protein